MALKKTDKEIQEVLDTYKRHVKFDKGVEIKSVTEVIHLCIQRSRPTYYYDTITGKKFGEQCRRAGMRSAEDMYRICKSYGFKVSLSTVKRKLTMLVNATYVNRSFCSVVKKDVHTLGYRGSNRTVEDFKTILKVK
jgi:hypothetical protein